MDASRMASYLCVNGDGKLKTEWDVRKASLIRDSSGMIVEVHDL